MSGYLANLARRGAGLAPLVRARIEPQVEAPIGEGPAAETAASATPPVPAAVGHPVPIAKAEPAAGVPGGADRSAVRSTVPVSPAAAPIAPVVQRLAAHSPVRAASASTPAAPIATVVHAASRPSEPPANSPPRAMPVPAPIAPAAAPPPLRAERAITREAPERPAGAATIVVREERTSATATHEIVREQTLLVDRRVEPAAAAPIATLSVEAESVPGPRVGIAATSLPDPAERLVTVHIGAIEIHAASPAPAPTPVAAAAAPVAPRPVAGFAEYARLRTYAPWQW